jgi:hypothetical protein
MRPLDQDVIAFEAHRENWQRVEGRATEDGAGSDIEGAFVVGADDLPADDVAIGEILPAVRAGIFESVEAVTQLQDYDLPAAKVEGTHLPGLEVFLLSYADVVRGQSLPQAK